MGIRFSGKTILLLSFFTMDLFAAGIMREISSMDMVREMKLGWNLGNTLDAPDGETSWGNPKTTKSMMDALKAKGFNSVRIPTTWEKHMGPAPDYLVDIAWMDRVEEIVKYVLDNNMYAILNTHHDEWVTLSESEKAVDTDRLTKLWIQIANRFKNYSDYLFFETLNEPRTKGSPNEWSGGTEPERQILNEYNALVVQAIRATGGNNSKRNILIPTYAASGTNVAQDALKLPAESSRIIISQHIYSPYLFALEKTGPSTWGTDKEKIELDSQMVRLYDIWVKKGIPVIIGEWGSIDKNNTTVRTAHAEYYAKAARLKNILPVWWDNGGDFGLLDRKNVTWRYESIADALVRGAEEGGKIATIPGVARVKNSSELTIKNGKIGFTLDKNTSVALTLYSIQGKRVMNLFNGVQLAGNHEVPKKTGYLPGGQYILEFRADEKRASTQMLLID